MNGKALSLVVCLLMIVSTIGSVSGAVLVGNTSHPLAKGNILYVGGSGPGNYSKIQDAVDNASVGDTVFVYDDSSPYKENITVSKSIIIKGENKLTTIIDGSHRLGHSFQINADNVTVTGFTIQNTGTGVYIGGIEGTESHNIVKDNIFLNTDLGINMYYGNPYVAGFSKYGYNIIMNNVIKNTKYVGIYSIKGRNNGIYGNTISQNHGTGGYGYAIELCGAYNNISNNNISNNDMYGIVLFDTYNTKIYRNSIENNGLIGLSMNDPSFDKIEQNNFIGNGKNVETHQSLMYTINSTFWHYPILPTIWKGNFWDKPRTLPYPIHARIDLYGFVFMFSGGTFSLINLLRFDWHPASQPYNISSV